MPVVTVNVALVLPAPTVTLDGTPATPLLSLANATDAPPLGAGPFNVTVPWEVDPPITLAGFSATRLNCEGPVPGKISQMLRLYRWFVGAVSLIVTVVPAAGVVLVCR